MVVFATGEVVSVVGLWLCPMLSSAMAVDVVRDLARKEISSSILKAMRQAWKEKLDEECSEENR